MRGHFIWDVEPVVSVTLQRLGPNAGGLDELELETIRQEVEVPIGR